MWPTNFHRSRQGNCNFNNKINFVLNRLREEVEKRLLDLVCLQPDFGPVLRTLTNLEDVGEVSVAQD